MIYERIDAQCFVRNEIKPLFPSDAPPKLRYICKVTPESNTHHKRVMHAHEDLAELVLIFSGESDYLIHNKKYHVKAGDLLVYNSGVVHDEYAEPEDGVGFYCAAIGNLALPGLPANTLCTKDAGFVFPTGERFEEIRTLMEMMFFNLVTAEPDAERFCDSIMRALIDKALVVIRAAAESAKPSGAGKEPSAIGQQVKDYIDQHYAEPLTLESIGRALYMSPWYVSHVFKEMSGYSPIQYLLRRRIGEAQTLLMSTKEPIAEIALRVGYESQSHFNAQFTKQVGMPPNQFRKNYVIKR